MAYSHTVQYYETDKMQCTHHSNYVRFMEEARVDFLEKIGYSFLRIEKDGVASPVVKVDLQFKKPTTFGDVIDIDVKLARMTAATVEFGYTMTCRGETVCLATSAHCFLRDGKPIAIRSMPELFALLTKLLS